MTSLADETPTVLARPDKPISTWGLIAWEAGAFVVIMLVASGLHFAYELSGFQFWVTAFGSVNESTFEHLKLFFWPAFAYALVQHAYIRKRVTNFWWAKAVAIMVAPIVLMISFYFYLGISLPLYGRGFLWADISTGALGVLAGNITAVRIMKAPDLGRRYAVAGMAIIIALAVMFVAFTYAPPKFFIFENFFRYTYAGEYGILPDYTNYLIFRKS